VNVLDLEVLQVTPGAGNLVKWRRYDYEGMIKFKIPKEIMTVWFWSYVIYLLHFQTSLT
jgi:hypothetical protein